MSLSLCFSETADRQTDRQTDRQAGRQTQTDRRRDRQTEREREREINYGRDTKKKKKKTLHARDQRNRRKGLERQG